MNTNTKHKEELSANRNYKDTIFRWLFSDKENLLSLYNAISGKHYEDPEALTIVTLKNAVYMGMKNDIAFVLETGLYLYEHQSTVNPNMPLRDLIYVTTVLQGIIRDEDLYSSKLIKLPTPRFVVFYNGTEPQPHKQILRLSDAYKNKTENPELELMVTQYNVNPSYNEELKRRCPELDGYIKYVEKTRKYHKTGMTYEEAVKKSVDECIEEGILKEFFVKNKAEVISMTIFEYDEEEHMRLEREEQYRKGEEAGEARGIEIGEARGINEGLKNQIRKKLAKGKAIPQIADEVEETEEKVLELIKEIETEQV